MYEKTLYLFRLIDAPFCRLPNASSTADGEDDVNGETKEEKKGMSKRDLSITKTNSYSDLFLDSTAVEKFIASKNIADTMARRMRSFYNTRNYQFSWFTSGGLTEQARAFWNLHDYVTTYDQDTSLRDKALQKRMDALIVEESLRASASPDFVQTELTLTKHFIPVHFKQL
jgi:hypothetical protein